MDEKEFRVSVLRILSLLADSVEEANENISSMMPSDMDGFDTCADTNRLQRVYSAIEDLEMNMEE